jgi:hypothetical protein
MNAGFDTVKVAAGLRFSETKEMSDRQGDSYPVMAVQAAFTDGYNLENVNSVSVNGIALASVKQGQYLNQSRNLYTTSTLGWSVNGYGTIPFNPSQSTPSELTFTGVHPFDTVSQSSGFTLQYEGAQPNSDLIVTCTFNPGETSYFIDSAAAYDGGSNDLVTNIVNDNGSVTLSTSDLQGFKTNRYITLVITHYNLDIQQASNGNNVAIISSYSTSIPLYLSN